MYLGFYGFRFQGLGFQSSRVLGFRVDRVQGHRLKVQGLRCTFSSYLRSHGSLNPKPGVMGRYRCQGMGAPLSLQGFRVIGFRVQGPSCCNNTKISPSLKLNWNLIRRRIKTTVLQKVCVTWDSMSAGKESTNSSLSSLWVHNPYTLNRAALLQEGKS